MNTRLQDSILSQARKDEASGCWLWTGQVSNSGHGRLMIKDQNNQTRMQSAEHVSYMAFIGEIPDGWYTHQTCNNRLCVNPEHMQLHDANAWRNQGVSYITTTTPASTKNTD